MTVRLSPRVVHANTGLQSQCSLYPRAEKREQKMKEEEGKKKKENPTDVGSLIILPFSFILSSDGPTLFAI